MQTKPVLGALLALYLVACSDGEQGSGTRGGGMFAAGVGATGAAAGGSGGGLVGTAASPSGAPMSFTGGMTAETPMMPMDPGIEPIVIDDCGDPNPAGLSGADAQRLKMGGAGVGRMLYPYDGTVFPRGMLPPTLMWDGAMSDAIYVHIKATHFEWHGCVKPTGPNQLELPAMVWEAASLRTLGTSDPFAIELSTMSGGNAAGPVAIQVTIAQATLKGSIYYNSYVSLAGGGLGSVLRIPPGGQAEMFLGGFGCYGCHTVSANGERLISHIGGDPGLSYALDPMTMPNPPQLSVSPLSGFAGLSPDGSVYIGGAHPAGAVRPQGTPQEFALINDAALHETDTGMVLPGSGIPPGAMMPTFSPDGTLVTFNDYAIAEGRSLAVMSYDGAARMASDHRVIFTDTDKYPGWPFVLPDSKAVVFARGENPVFSGNGAGVIPGTGALGPVSDLFMVDLDTGASTMLARAMGFATPDDTVGYVPFGADDLHKHYYPTVSPVSAGGYFWLFFDSIRNYGNLGQMRQLWGTAISISPDGDYSTDRSHPAFYVPGQELGTGNHRAFAALDACVQDGEDCLTGIDCCGGFCFIEEDTNAELGQSPKGKCTSQTPECSKQDERCGTDADCCPPEPGKLPNSCIAGFCAHIVVVE